MTIDYTKVQDQQPPSLQPQSRGWWARNWKWVLAIGCLTPMLLLGACAAALAWFVFGAIKSSDVYTDALARVRANPEVTARLGTPIEPGWWVTGEINYGPADSGSAQFKAPISGPKGDAYMQVVATLDNEGWDYRTLRVEFKEGPPIDLIQASPSPEGSTDTAPPTD